MEVLGAVASGVTLAALFKCTFEALDLIHLYQTQDVDFKRLQLQYNLEKCRLYNWGDQMGLADDSKQNLLSEWHSKELVAEALRQVIALFSDAHVISKKYGCDNTTSSTALPLQAPEDSRGITRAFNHFKINSSNTDECMPRLRKTKWVVRDRKKFLLLISEVRSLIDSLEKITSDLSTSARLEGFFRDRINGINNVDTLFDIASIWKESHPRVASAASIKADSISLTSGRQEFISQWESSVDLEACGDTHSLFADVEDLTITELKHSVISSNVEVKTLQETLQKSQEEHREAVTSYIHSQMQQMNLETEALSSKLKAATASGTLGIILLAGGFLTIFHGYQALFSVPMESRKQMYPKMLREDKFVDVFEHIVFFYYTARLLYTFYIHRRWFFS